jgi:hypothetical protein
MATTDLNATVPITVSLDLQELLNATVGPIPAYTGDPDDYQEPPPPLHSEIIGAAAHLVARKLMSDATGYQGLQSRIRDAIDAKLGEMVTAELDKPFKPVDSYGEVLRSAEPTSLRAQIGKQAAEALAKGMAPSDRYSSDSIRGALKKYIDTEIDRQIKGELAETVKQAKAAVVDKVKANVTQVITDTITRTAVR